jgi:hypothetical protein
MPRMAGQTGAIAVGVTSANQLAGLIDEFMRVNSAIRVLATAPTAGGPTTCSFIIGNAVQVNQAQIANPGVFPIVPDHVLAQAGAFAGERLILTFTAVGAIAAPGVQWAVDVEPLT